MADDVSTAGAPAGAPVGGAELGRVGVWGVYRGSDNKPLYVHAETQETQTLKPAEVEEAELDHSLWDEFKSREGYVFVKHRQTGAKAWKKPPRVDEEHQRGWGKRLTPGGRVFWKNMETGEKQWEAPKDLDPSVRPPAGGRAPPTASNLSSKRAYGGYGSALGAPPASRQASAMTAGPNLSFIPEGSALQSYNMSFADPSGVAASPPRGMSPPPGSPPASMRGGYGTAMSGGGHPPPGFLSQNAAVPAATEAEDLKAQVAFYAAEHEAQVELRKRQDARQTALNNAFLEEQKKSARLARDLQAAKAEAAEAAAAVPAGPSQPALPAAASPAAASPVAHTLGTPSPAHPKPLPPRLRLAPALAAAAGQTDVTPLGGQQYQVYQGVMPCTGSPVVYNGSPPRGRGVSPPPVPVEAPPFVSPPAADPQDLTGLPQAAELACGVCAQLGPGALQTIAKNSPDAKAAAAAIMAMMQVGAVPPPAEPAASVRSLAAPPAAFTQSNLKTLASLPSYQMASSPAAGFGSGKTPAADETTTTLGRMASHVRPFDADPEEVVAAQREASRSRLVTNTRKASSVAAAAAAAPAVADTFAVNLTLADDGQGGYIVSPGHGAPNDPGARPVELAFDVTHNRAGEVVSVAPADIAKSKDSRAERQLRKAEEELDAYADLVETLQEQLATAISHQQASHTLPAPAPPLNVLPRGGGRGGQWDDGAFRELLRPELIEAQLDRHRRHLPHAVRSPQQHAVAEVECGAPPPRGKWVHAGGAPVSPDREREMQETYARLQALSQQRPAAHRAASFVPVQDTAAFHVGGPM